MKSMTKFSPSHFRWTTTQADTPTHTDPINTVKSSIILPNGAQIDVQVFEDIVRIICPRRMEKLLTPHHMGRVTRTNNFVTIEFDCHVGVYFDITMSGKTFQLTANESETQVEEHEPYWAK